MANLMAATARCYHPPNPPNDSRHSENSPRRHGGTRLQPTAPARAANQLPMQPAEGAAETSAAAERRRLCAMRCAAVPMRRGGVRRASQEAFYHKALRISAQGAIQRRPSQPSSKDSTPRFTFALNPTSNVIIVNDDNDDNDNDNEDNSDNSDNNSISSSTASLNSDDITNHNVPRLQRSDSVITNGSLSKAATNLSIARVGVVPRLSLAGRLARYDPRFPAFLGDWARSLPTLPSNNASPAIDDLDEPHIKRKRTILARHPQITSLYGPEATTKFLTAALALVQLVVAYIFGHQWYGHWWRLLLVVYLFGAVATQTFGVVIHEAAHGLCAKTIAGNRAVGFLANVCIPFPIYASFRRYHLEHHAYQGVEGRDPDLPLAWEARFVGGNSLFKLIFVFCYPLMYVVRGLAQQKSPGRWELFNLAFTAACDVAIYNICGLGGLLYLIACLWVGYGLHPAAAHFIQEHFTFDEGQETYSYYGIMNLPMLNIGLHNEHHDFTQVPWSRLPMVTRIAPEFYLSMAYHTSWFWTIVNFIIYPDIGPQSRVVRTIEDHKYGRSMLRFK